MGVEGFKRGRRKRGRKKRWEFKAACYRGAVAHESDCRSRQSTVGSSISVLEGIEEVQQCSALRKEAIRNEALCCNTWRVANLIPRSAKFLYYSALQLNPDRCIDSVEAREEE